MEGFKTERELIKLINNIVDKKIWSVLCEERVVQIQPAMVAEYNAQTNKAKISFYQDAGTICDYWYPNRTGHSLVNGSKVYVMSIIDNVDQGFLIDFTSLSNG